MAHGWRGYYGSLYTLVRPALLSPRFSVLFHAVVRSPPLKECKWRDHNQGI